jgi:hypothetical protein
MAEPQQVYDDSGKPLQVIYDDNGKPIQPSTDQQRTFLGALGELGKGLLQSTPPAQAYEGAKSIYNAVTKGITSTALAERANNPVYQAMDALRSGQYGTAAAKTGDALGLNTSNISSDISGKNYGALTADALPPLLMLSGGMLSKFGEPIASEAPIPKAEPPIPVKTPISPEIVNEVPSNVKLLNAAPTLSPSRQLPAVGETSTTSPRFYDGPAGIADARMAYPYQPEDVVAGTKPGTMTSTEQPGVSAPSDIGPINAANRTALAINDPAQLNPAFRALVPDRYGPQQVPLGLQGIPKDNLETTLEQPAGGRVVTPPAKEVPFNSNQVDIMNQRYSPARLAQTIDANPATVGQRPIPDLINSVPVEPNTPADITTPRAGMATPTGDVGKWRANIASADKILDQYPETAPISNRIRGAQDAMLPWLHQQLDIASRSLGRTPIENQQIFNILDGKLDPTTVDPAIADKAMMLRQQLDATHAGLPGKVGYISDYITHMHDSTNPSQQTLWGYFFGKKAPQEVMQPGNPEAVGNIQSPYTEQRTGALEDYSQNLPKVLRGYFSSIARLKFMDPAVDAAKEQIKAIPDTLPKVKAVAQAYVRNVTNYDAEGQLATEYQNWANAVANTYNRSYLDWNVQLHMLHLGEIPSSVFPELGAKYTAIGAKNFATNPAASTREIASNGLLQNQVIPPAFQTASERLQTAANFWNVAEAVTKGVAYQGAKQRAIDMGMSPQQAVMKAIADTKDMTYTVDPSRMAKGLTSQSNIAGGQIASRVGQKFKGVPLKIIEQYKNIIANTRNNPAQTARLLFGAGLAAGGTAKGIHTFHMNPTNLLKPTVLGPFGDLITTVGNDLVKGDLASAVGNTMAWAVPGGQTIKQLIK